MRNRLRWHPNQWNLLNLGLLQLSPIELLVRGGELVESLGLALVEVNYLVLAKFRELVRLNHFHTCLLELFFSHIIQLIDWQVEQIRDWSRLWVSPTTVGLLPLDRLLVRDDCRDITSLFVLI